MKAFLKKKFSWFIIVFAFCISIYSCQNKNILNLSRSKYYRENNIIKPDSIFTLLQSVCYDRPGRVDEEFCYELKIVFPDTSILKSKKKLQLPNDSVLVKAAFNRFSVWDWDSDSTYISGVIDILSMNSDNIELKENLRVYDLRTKKEYRIKGGRRYSLKKRGTD